MTLSPGSRLGPYEVKIALGAGGMGEVYRARDPRLERDVAIKVLSEEGARDRDRLRRFTSEAKAASALNHPNILTVHEVGEAESGPYLVTELVEGSTLRAMLAGGRLPPSQALELANQMADGMAKAHQAGIVHRDLKPDNVMVSGDGFVKILDFGLAKLRAPEEAGEASHHTATGTVMGTLGYISPEQLRGEGADARSDVFALGVVLYEMLSGGNPFRRGSAAETATAILRDEPPPLSALVPLASPGMAQAVARAMAKSPADRFADARELAGELRRLRTGPQTDIPPTQDLASAFPEASRTVKPAVLVAAAVLLAAVAFALIRDVRRPPAAVPGTAPEAAPASTVVAMPAAHVLPSGRMAVAVMPIHDESGGAAGSGSVVGKVLTNAFVQVLSDLPELHVVSPLRLDSAARALGRPLEDAGRDLPFARAVSEKAEAMAMLTGTLARLGETYVLNATLTEIPSERLLGTFSAEATKPDRLLMDLTSGVSDSLRRKLGATKAPAPGAVDRVATSSLDAYARYVKGRDLLAEGRWQEARPELEATLAIDPNMALAWSELSCAYSFMGDDAHAIAAHKKAEGLLDRVNRKERMWIELNGLWVTGNGQLWQKAADRFIQHYPDDRDGYYYAGLGAEWLDNDCQKAIGYYEKGYALTPTYYPIARNIAECQAKLGRSDLARAALQGYLALPRSAEHGRTQIQAQLARLQVAAR